MDEKITHGIPEILYVKYPPYQFNFKKDESVILERKPYPGDIGQVWVSKIRIPIIHPEKGEVDERIVNSILFDSQFGRDQLLTNRLVTGSEARYPYRVCCRTVALFLANHFPFLLEDSCEQEILRAGVGMSMSEFVPGMESRQSDFKRRSVDSPEMFEADSTELVYWSGHTNQWAVDICPATGSTDIAVEESCCFGPGKASNIRRLIFNNSTGTFWAIGRSSIHIPKNIEIWRINWEAFFSIFRQDIVLENGEKIYAGTLINVNPDSDPRNIYIAPPGVVEYLHEIFNRSGSWVLADVPGEVGEKIQSPPIGPRIYDLLESYTTGWDLNHPVWREKFVKTMEIPGLAKNLKDRAPNAYKYHMQKYEIAKKSSVISSSKHVF